MYFKNRARTIGQFSRQFSRYSELTDPILRREKLTESQMRDELFLSKLLGRDIKGLRIAEIGAGTGRWTLLLAEMAPKNFLVIEPSDGIRTIRNQVVMRFPAIDWVLRQEQVADQISFQADLAIAVGVLHHIEDAQFALQTWHGLLAKRGELVLWVYQKQSKVALTTVTVVRGVCKLLPDSLIAVVARSISKVLVVYSGLPKGLATRLPYLEYCQNNFLSKSPEDRELTIFDQLRPQIAEYYSAEEMMQMCLNAGFHHVVTERDGQAGLIVRCKVSV